MEDEGVAHGKNPCSGAERRRAASDEEREQLRLKAEKQARAQAMGLPDLDSWSMKPLTEGDDPAALGRGAVETNGDISAITTIFWSAAFFTSFFVLSLMSAY